MPRTVTDSSAIARTAGWRAWRRGRFDGRSAVVVSLTEPARPPVHGLHLGGGAPRRSCAARYGRRAEVAAPVRAAGPATSMRACAASIRSRPGRAAAAMHVRRHACAIELLAVPAARLSCRDQNSAVDLASRGLSRPCRQAARGRALRAERCTGPVFAKIRNEIGLASW
jgi:hypothetical protein